MVEQPGTGFDVRVPLLWTFRTTVPLRDLGEADTDDVLPGNSLSGRGAMRTHERTSPFTMWHLGCSLEHLERLASVCILLFAGEWHVLVKDIGSGHGCKGHQPIRSCLEPRSEKSIQSCSFRQRRRIYMIILMMGFVFGRGPHCGDWKSL